jgi:D-sedoheptulose 7-phosphate isomerase
MEKFAGVRCPTGGGSRINQAKTSLRSTIAQHVALMLQLKALEPQIEQAAQKMIWALRCGGKVLWIGNGGSAADSQHLAAELVGRFVRERRGLASIALTTNSSVLTALSNDFSFEDVFSRQIEALCCPEDVVVAISTSGKSPNVVAGLCAARRLGAFTIALTGGNGMMAENAHLCIRVPSHITARIQEAHILIGHVLCDWVDAELN